MQIPDFTVNSKVVDPEGQMSKDFALMLSQLLIQLREHLPDDGYVQPSVDTTTINALTQETIGDDRNDKYYQPKIIHDKDKNLYRCNDLNGKYLAFQTKLTKQYDHTKAWIDVSTGKLTQDAVDFLNQFVEELG